MSAYRKRVAPGVYKSTKTGRYSIRYKVDGRVVDRGGYRTLEAARTARTRAMADVSRGVKARPRKTTVAAYYEEWWPRYEARVRPNTARTARSTFKVHILPRLGRERLTDLSPRQLQTWLDAVHKKSPTAANRARATLSVMFDDAVHFDVMFRNPLRGVRQRPIPKSDRLTFTAQELVAYIAVAPPAMGWVALSACRVGEMRAMRWADLDLESGTWTVRASMESGAASSPVGKTKTPDSQRNVPITDAMRLLLPEPAGPTDLVWGTWSYHRWHSMHDWACTDAGVKRIRIHDLRHTWATLALKMGTHPKLVQQQLGHAKISTTLDTYSHVLPEMSRSAAEGLESMLFEAAGEGNRKGIEDSPVAAERFRRSDEES